MTLTNQNVVEISQFAIKAKKHIGLVKVAEMYSNQDYALDILIKSVLTGDIELIKLSKSLCIKFDIGIDLLIAVQSYMNTLKTKGLEPAFIKKNSDYLSKLASYLHEIEIDGVTYRRVIDQLIAGLDSKEKAFCINLAREFYPFCRNNFGLAEDGGTKNDESRQEFIRVWNTVDDEFFYEAETKAIHKYMMSMENKATPEEDDHIRAKIAKVIILEIRNHDQASKSSYRTAINIKQKYFSYHDMQGLYFDVSREFYNYWVNNRDIQQTNQATIKSNS